MASLSKLVYGAPTDKCAVTVRLGIEKGFFKEEGLDLSVRVIFGGPPLAAAYDSGEIEVGEMGSPPAVNAMSRGARFKIIGGAVRRKAHMYLGIRSDIHTFQEFKGKRLGMLSRGSCPEWIGRAMFMKEGLEPDRDFTFVPMEDEYPRIIAAMREGRIEGALAVEPNLSIGEAEGLLKVWAAAYDEPYLPHFQWIIIVANTGFIARRPELLRALLRAYRRSAHYAAAHVDEWVAFAARQYGIAEATARRAVERELPHLHLDAQVDMAGLRKVIELQRQLGAVTCPLTPEEIVDLRFLPSATQPVSV